MEANGAASEPQTYKAALQELDGLLARLEGETLDIDELAPNVERAAVLLDYCRGKLDETKQRVDEVLRRPNGTEPATPQAKRPAPPDDDFGREIPF